MKHINHKGFSLLEILLTITLLSILFAILVNSINPNNILSRIQDNQREADALTIYQALEQYALKNNTYPEAIKNLSNNNSLYICKTSAPNCNNTNQINLSSILVPTYLSKIPEHSTDTNNSGFYVVKDSNGKIGIGGVRQVNNTTFVKGLESQSFVTIPTPPIVTNGLVLHLDAGNPASYPGTGNTWFDLSGNGNNGTLVNGVGYNSDNGGSLVFDGVDENATVGSSVLTTGETTISMWVKPDSNQTSGLGDLNVGGGGLILYKTGTIIMMGFRGTPEMRTTTQFITSNVWNHITWVYNNGSKSSTSSFKIYLNSEIEPTLTTFGGIGGGTVFNRIGSDQNAPYFDGNISQVSIYNRALTASEIQQNFNALRGRFGL